MRKVWLSLSESYPLRQVFVGVVVGLRQLAERPLTGAGGAAETG